MSHTNRRGVLIVSGFTALADALEKYPGAQVVTMPSPREASSTATLNESFLALDYREFVGAASDARPSRGPAPRRKFPVRR